jgi:hypothetical protein
MYATIQIYKHYQPLPKNVRVPNPKLSTYSSDIPNPKMSVRSVARRKETSLKSTRRKAEAFLKFAPIFEVDIDVEGLTKSTVDLKVQQQICDTELGPNQPAQCFSGQWRTGSGQALLFYIADRWADLKKEDVSVY